MSDEPRPAVAVVPVMNGRALCGRRSLDSRSFGGFLAFPGGSVDEEDKDLPLASGRADAHRAGGLREAGEETGRWWVCARDGAPASEAARETFCATLNEGIAAALEKSELVLDDRGMIELGEWITASFVPRRFCVRQYLLPVDEDASVQCAPTDELLDIDWVKFEDLHARWSTGDVLLLPPALWIVEQLLGKDPRDEDTHRALRDVPGYEHARPREIVRGICVQPLRTPTLPPATHTNCVLVGSRDMLIIDPATPYTEEQEQFDALLDDLVATGRRPLAIALTHHHIDHVGDVARLAAARDLEVWTSEETRERVDFRVDRILEAGERIVLEGEPRRELEVVETPGHARGHLCFFETETRTVIAGDMIASIGSILIDPPEGHMGTYLASLQALIDRDPRRAVPSHGPLLAAGKARLERQLAHRLARQRSVLEALSDAPQRPIELVEAVYAKDTPRAMWALAARSILAALELLTEEGRAVSNDGERWVKRDTAA